MKKVIRMMPRNMLGRNMYGRTFAKNLGVYLEREVVGSPGTQE